MVEYYNWSNTGSFALDQTSLISHGRIQRGGGGGRGSGPSILENHKWLKISLELLVRIPLERRLDPSGPVASRLRNFEWSSVKYVDT